jgi:hypothetical protein
VVPTDDGADTKAANPTAAAGTRTAPLIRLEPMWALVVLPSADRNPRHDARGLFQEGNEFRVIASCSRDLALIEAARAWNDHRSSIVA